MSPKGRWTVMLECLVRVAVIKRGDKTMNQIIIRAIMVMALMLSLSWAGKAMAQTSEPADHEVFMGEGSWEELGVDTLSNPCTGEDIQFDGTFQYTFVVVEVDNTSGEHVLELQQIHGSAAGLDDAGNAYMANLAASVQYECTPIVEGCQVAHVTVRSRTAQNFEITFIIKANSSDGSIVVEKGQATCQATGAAEF